MPLTPGSRVGVYEVVGPIGAGGMGEVYRARDAKLQRDVAIKVLPDLFARDPERLARFEREARTLAALNHPHIAHVYGVEGAALIMEFVDGEDLSQRISSSGRIPIEDALPIAIQIAEALEAAHEQGIIHRDLKPANIKVRPDGAVKVLDFGLAKALHAPDAAGPASAASIENSPTITSPFQMSALGVILGTAAYMAPEQAKGKPLDKRVDIWAFGCVLYEMLTGKRPFAGEDVTDTLAAIVRADPDWTALPAGTPPAIRRLLVRCLAKDRRERLPDIGAARLELKDARDAGSAEPAVVSPAPRRTILPWALFALASLAALAAAGYAAFMRPPADTQVIKSVMGAPRELSGAPALRLAISPDGRRMAFSAPDASGATMLWIRSLDNHVAQPLPGTAHATAPFWSADSRSVGFIGEGKLRRIDASGGPVLTICDATTAPAGTWNRDDVIIFSGLRGPLWRVSASGGTPEVVTELVPARGERIHIQPFFLPDGRHFIYTAGAGGSRAIGLFVGSLDSKNTEPLLAGAANGMYANGYLLFLRDTTLMAQRFDPETRQLSGEARPVATDVQINPATGTGAYSVSQTGVLVYQTGAAAGTLLVWRDRHGKQLDTLGTQSANRDLQLSPDGTRASVTIPTNGSDQPDVYVFELNRGGLQKRLTFGGGEDAVWTPDGRRIAFASRRKTVLDLFLKNASGDGPEEALFEDSADKFPIEFTPDGRFLLYAITTGAASGHVWMLPMSGGRTPRPFNHTKYSETPSAISPDGRWAAYVSDESGRREVYVTSFPDASGKWQVSTSGGDNPRWRRDGKEMFFTSGDRFYAVDVHATGAQFDSGVVQALFEVRVPAATLGTRSTYAVSNDGQRFLFNMWDPQAASAPISLIVNWPATLRR